MEEYAKPVPVFYIIVSGDIVGESFSDVVKKLEECGIVINKLDISKVGGILTNK